MEDDQICWVIQGKDLKNALSSCSTRLCRVRVTYSSCVLLPSVLASWTTMSAWSSVGDPRVSAQPVVPKHPQNHLMYLGEEITWGGKVSCCPLNLKCIRLEAFLLCMDKWGRTKFASFQSTVDSWEMQSEKSACKSACSIPGHSKEQVWEGCKEGYSALQIWPYMCDISSTGIFPSL